MSNRIERLRYYDGEYLRGYDFEAEQVYHMEMRRRLNVKLHLYGIVTGLELQADPTSQPPEAPFFVVSTGMAIDQLGREIILENPYILRREEVLNKKGVETGQNEIWICYRESASGRPAAGYELCNDPNQNTRYRESFDVLLVPIPKPAPQPGIDVVDPDAGRKGVRLGTVEVENDVTGGLRFKSVSNEKRTYIGLRAQRVVAPDLTADTFKTEKNNSTSTGDPLPGYLDIMPPVSIRGNVMARSNGVVGPDFEIKPADAFSTLPDLTKPGNLKVAQNLILNGSLIASVDGKWYGLGDYIKTFLPEFVFDTTTITPTPNTNPSAGTAPTITKTSTLPRVSNAVVMVAVNGIVGQGKAALAQWWTTLTPGDLVQVQVNGVAQRHGNSPNQWDFVFSWTVGPKNHPAGQDPSLLHINEIKVNYLIVFYP